MDFSSNHIASPHQYWQFCGDWKLKRLKGISVISSFKDR
ncbi:hypothetical protein SeH_A3662 [Salmonella enterica subsp. enterica serovar Hadar str. RI_05P066]|nr:hypothetical protein SeH_A3662 [Salmonella enterica subsp. enterica serovar Hadar str. RI_05P066]